jgi:UPF0176 protein
VDFIIAALYKFFTLDRPEVLQAKLKHLFETQNILGTIILASEGLNGTVCATRAAIDALKIFLVESNLAQGCEYKEVIYSKQVFRRAKVKVKAEIVTLKVPVDPTKMVGQYVEPKDWNNFISQQDTIVIDTRNDYEYKIGTFKGAENPNTQTFSELVSFVKQKLADKKTQKIAMMCTGGVRCEKSTSLLLQQGFENVFHLKGGILNYLAQIPPEESLWQGECYVFDQRVSVVHGLEKGKCGICSGCATSILPEEIEKFNKQCQQCFELKV